MMTSFGPSLPSPKRGRSWVAIPCRIPLSTFGSKPLLGCRGVLSGAEDVSKSPRIEAPLFGAAVFGAAVLGAAALGGAALGVVSLGVVALFGAIRLAGAVAFGGVSTCVAGGGGRSAVKSTTRVTGALLSAAGPLCCNRVGATSAGRALKRGAGSIRAVQFSDATSISALMRKLA